MYLVRLSCGVCVTQEAGSLDTLGLETPEWPCLPRWDVSRKGNVYVCSVFVICCLSESFGGGEPLSITEKGHLCPLPCPRPKANPHDNVLG